MSELTKFAKLFADKMRDERYSIQRPSHVIQDIIYRVVEEMEAEEDTTDDDE